MNKEEENTKLKIENLEAEFQFSGEFDDLDALITISGGAGGVDAQDWASMILRMYLRWTDKKIMKHLEQELNACKFLQMLQQEVLIFNR